MAKTTLTFELGGKVDIRRLAEGFASFRRLIDALTGKTGVTWVVDDLRPGSAVATFRGEASNPADAERIIEAFEDIGRTLEHREDAQYKPQVKRAIDAIEKLAANVDYVRFETAAADHTIYGNGRMPTQPSTTIAVGAIAGRVQMLSNRGSLRFNLYDTVHDRAVACYVAPDQQELMRETWGRLARVSGLVSRHRATGVPLAIRQILAVEIIEDGATGAYREARGAIAWQEGELLPEDAVRRLRDA